MVNIEREWHPRLGRDHTVYREAAGCPNYRLHSQHERNWRRVKVGDGKGCTTVVGQAGVGFAVRGTAAR